MPPKYGTSELVLMLDDWYDRKREMDKFRRSYKEPDFYKMSKKEFDRQRAYQMVEQKKHIRVDKAINKECSECEESRPHDADDYKCIVCRDGIAALPKFLRGAKWGKDVAC